MSGSSLKKNFYTMGVQTDIEMPPLPVESVTQEVVAEQPEKHFPDTQDEEVEQEVAAESTEVDQEDNDQVEEVEQAPKVAVKSREDNFRAIREAKEKAERERDILLQELAKRQDAYQAPTKTKQVVEETDADNELDLLLEDEALVEGKHAKKIIQAVKKMRDEMRSNQNRSYQDSVETRIRSNFPDFEDVVSSENVEKLNEMHPEIAQSLKDTSDMYTKASAAYKIMKSMGIYNPRKAESMANRKVISQNAAKPRSAASVAPQQGDNPLTKANAFANGLTPELKKQLHKEMIESAKRR